MIYHALSHFFTRALIATINCAVNIIDIVLPEGRRLKRKQNEKRCRLVELKIIKLGVIKALTCSPLLVKDQSKNSSTKNQNSDHHT